ncbi:uncharacterized protein LOC131250561 [Magnolia sinica]|uniref:uncharacterized protein LOC131250561 n=1 Tax=Magnolia sinica TaxID=86752 RepID=UPI00265B60EB|nr:uncharacterized protein LOC131250561 [Magnolia sinica]
MFNGNHSRELERLRKGMKDRAEYSVYGELAAFIAYWLSIVVFPSSKSVDAIRPSLFVVAGVMAEGVKYSLAPPALCSIYRASHQEGTTATASPVFATAAPQLENHQSPPSKRKQVVVEESGEGDSNGESSTSSSGHTISNENETEGENQDDDYEEGEVYISGEDNIIVEDVLADEGHILPTSEVVPVKTSPIAGEEKDEPLDYGEYGYSPCDHVTNTEADNTSPIDLPPVVLAASSRFLMPPRVVAREIAFLVESIDLPTPTTVDSSTEARAPSFAEMVEPDPSLVRETQLLTVSAPAEGNLPQSGTTSSGSIGTSSNVLSFEKVSVYKLGLIRNTILAIVEMFKDPD